MTHTAGGSPSKKKARRDHALAAELELVLRGDKEIQMQRAWCVVLGGGAWDHGSRYLPLVLGLPSHGRAMPLPTRPVRTRVIARLAV